MPTNDLDETALKVLLTGATGYIGKRLLPLLVKRGYDVVCCVRDKSRFSPAPSVAASITVIEVDLLNVTSLDRIPDDIDCAYYLVHSMSASMDYQSLEQQSAINFRDRLSQTAVKQVIFLSGIVNEANLSEHLLSRKTVEDILKQGSYGLTCLRAGIVVGSGSASFEIMRDLVEKLPVMIAPKWLLTKCEPIGVRDVLKFLVGCLLRAETFDRDFDIGSGDVLTYKEMLLQLAEVRQLKRRIWTVPVMTPKLSSYWLYFVTSTSYKLARCLVDSMKVEVVCRDHQLNELLGIRPIPYKEALQRAFERVQNNEILSSWKDSYSSSGISMNISDFIAVPEFGCYKDRRTRPIPDGRKCVSRIWGIGGENGWYYGNWLWKLRGMLDKMAGGVGLRRGRTNQQDLSPGDALDFWRVLYSDKKEGRLLLFAEMKLPGEAWLEFKMIDNQLVQTATFRPWGVMGRLYWHLVIPFHEIIFTGLIDRLTRK